MQRVLEAAAVTLAGYVALALLLNGIAGVLQPSLGAGAGEGTLRTFSEDGEVYERRLAVLDDNGTLWLVSVQHFRRWYDRLVQNPDVELLREGELRSYRAVPVDDADVDMRLERILVDRAGAWRFRVMRAGWLFAPIKAVRLDPR